MRNDLIIKEINFYGDNLVAVKDKNTDKIYTGVSYICKGVGLSKSQKDTQVQNVQTDLVLKKGCLKFEAGVFDSNNETIAIDIDYLPLWLAKINITPSMKTGQLEVVERLIEYQLKAKDALAEVFLGKKPTCLEDILIQQLQEMKDMRLQIEKASQETAAVKQEVEDIREVVEIRPSQNWRSETNSLITKICYKLKDYQKPKDEIYKALQERASCDLKVRLKNMRGRLALEGATKTKIDNLNYLDVIAEDKKLIEIYTAIAKEMAIKYKIA
ncbi:MAG: phage antirepressor N-terminal domain-containing protein [Bacillota bacterium]|nr:phage antirepressor N-terminal domain-containing protein [Bacillota bacterium]